MKLIRLALALSLPLIATPGAAPLAAAQEARDRIERDHPRLTTRERAERIQRGKAARRSGKQTRKLKR